MKIVSLKLKRSMGKSANSMHFPITIIVSPILDSHTKQNKDNSICESNCQSRVLTKTYGLERKYRSNSICIYKDQGKLEQVQTSMVEVA